MTNIRLKSLDEFQDVMTHNGIRLLQGLLPQTTILKMANKASRENSRTPMQWNREKNAGFTEGEPWFYVNPNYSIINVEQQEKDPDSILNFYRKAIALRKELPVVRYGDYQEHFPMSASVYTYSRTMEGQKILVVCSFTKDETHLFAPKGFDLSKAKLVLQNYENAAGDTLAPYECRVYLWEE